MTTFAQWARFASLLLLSCLPVSVGLSQGGAGSESRVSSAVDEEPPSAMQLYRQYLEKSGGLAHLSKLNSVKMSGYMLLGPDQERVDISIIRKRPSRVRTKIEFPNYTTETVFDGKSGVRRYFDAADNLVQREELVGEELASFSRTASMDGLFHQLGTRLDEIELIAWDTLDGVPVIRVELIEGNELGYTAIWLDRETLQESKLARVEKGADGGEDVVEETYFAEMDQIEGYYFPRLSRTFVGGQLEQELHVERIRLNSGIFDSFFTIR